MASRWFGSSASASRSQPTARARACARAGELLEDVARGADLSSAGGRGSGGGSLDRGCGLAVVGKTRVIHQQAFLAELVLRRFPAARRRARPRTTSRPTKRQHQERSARAREPARDIANASSRHREPRICPARSTRGLRAHDWRTVMDGQSRGTAVGALKPVQIVGSADMSCTKVKVWRSTIDRIQVR